MSTNTQQQNNDIAAKVVNLIGNPVENFEPFAFHNADGDCIEFFLSNDMYYGDRIDDYITVYRSQSTDQIVGSVIKNVHRLCNELSRKQPGFAVFIQEGTVRILHLILAYGWLQEDLPQAYKELAYLTEKGNFAPIQMTSV